MSDLNIACQIASKRHSFLPVRLYEAKTAMPRFQGLLCLLTIELWHTHFSSQIFIIEEILFLIVYYHVQEGHNYTSSSEDTLFLSPVSMIR